MRCALGMGRAHMHSQRSPPMQEPDAARYYLRGVYGMPRYTDAHCRTNPAQVPVLVWYCLTASVSSYALHVMNAAALEAWGMNLPGPWFLLVSVLVWVGT